jgi:hypothetical protein
MWHKWFMGRTLQISNETDVGEKIMTDEQKRWIDNANYEQLLRRWRFAPTGDLMFQGDTGDYYKEVMFKKRDANPDEAVQASKNIGWGK